jgi:hypothetical protein
MHGRYRHIGRVLNSPLHVHKTNIKKVYLYLLQTVVYSSRQTFRILLQGSKGCHSCHGCLLWLLHTWYCMRPYAPNAPRFVILYKPGIFCDLLGVSSVWNKGGALIYVQCCLVNLPKIQARLHEQAGSRSIRSSWQEKTGRPSLLSQAHRKASARGCYTGYNGQVSIAPKVIMDLDANVINEGLCSHHSASRRFRSLSLT